MCIEAPLHELSDPAIRQMRMFRDASLSITLQSTFGLAMSSKNTEAWRRNAGAGVFVTRERILPEVIPADVASIDSNAMMAFLAGAWPRTQLCYGNGAREAFASSHGYNTAAAA